MFDIFEYKDKLKNWFVQKGRVITYASIDDDLVLYVGTDPIERVDLLVHNYDLQFTQSTYIGEVGDTITVDVLLTDCDGAVSGEAITLTGDGSEYTSNTNSNGVASFSISDLSTVGTFTFTASYGSVSAECTVINAYFLDDGVSETATWNNTNATMTVIDNEYTEITKTVSTSNATVYADATMYAPFVVEFDNHTETDSSCYFYTNGGNFFALSGRSITGECHVKVIVEADKITPIVDGVTKSSSSGTIDFSQGIQTGFRVASSSAKTIGFSNYQVYKLESS